MLRLLRRDGESLIDLLNRLDIALETALTQENYTTPRSTPARQDGPKRTLTGSRPKAWLRMAEINR